MTITLSLSQLRRIRLRNQALSAAADTPSSVVGLVRRLCALQSQEWQSAQLALHARADGISQADIIQAREIERSFLLSWTFRGTLHLVAAEDIGWQLALAGERAIRGSGRRYQQLGLTEEAREKGLVEIADILGREGALSRAQLAQRLGERGIPVAGQAIHHLVRFAALRGLICLGPEIEGDLNYVLLADWLPADPSVSSSTVEPLPELARRYLAAYAPATAEDLARWSGLSASQAKAALATIAGQCAQVETPDGAAWMLREQLEQLSSAAQEPTVRLLPRYDNYLLGYESRAFMVAEAHAKQVHPGGGLIRACVIIDGEALASWKLEKRRNGLRIRVTPYERLDPAHLPLLEAEVRSLGEFFDTDAELLLESG